MSGQLRAPDDTYKLLHDMEKRGLMPPWGLVENVKADLSEYSPMLGSLNAAFECLGAYHLCLESEVGERDQRHFGLGVAWGADLAPNTEESVMLCTPDTIHVALEAFLS